MNFSQFAIILKVRLKLILVVASITLLTAVVISLLLPKNFLATTTVLINYKGVDPVTGVPIPAQLAPGYMGTQAQIIESKIVALEVVKKLNLTEIPSIKADFERASENGNLHVDAAHWLSEKLLRNLDVKPSRESSVINISYKGVEPNFAATMANTFAQAYIATNIKLKMDPAIKASEYLSDQTNTLRENLHKAQEKLAQYQQEHGLTSIQEALDVEGAKLRDLSGQYSQMQAQASEANSRKNDAAKNITDSPDVSMTPIVQNLRINLATAESKLAEMGQRFSKNHPSYIAAEAEVAKLRSQLDTEVNRTVASLGHNATINSQRLGDAKSQLEKQKQKVLELNKYRSELLILEKEVALALGALEVVNNRFSQTVLEGQSNQSDVTILEPATPPSSPSNPSLFLIVPFSLILGGMLGCFFALIAEFLDRKIRSKDDLQSLGETLGEIPVFEYTIKSVRAA